MNLKIVYLGDCREGTSTFLYQPDTKEAFLLTSRAGRKSLIRFTPAYDIGDELRTGALEQGADQEIPDEEFAWLCEATRNYCALDDPELDPKRAPNLVSLLCQFSETAGIPPAPSGSVF